MGRAFYTFEVQRQGDGNWAIDVLATAVAPMWLATWSLSKGALASLATIGFKVVVDIQSPRAGVHFTVVVGGGATDYVGVISEEAVALEEGRYASERLELDISGLFAGGRTMEFVKLFAWFDSSVPGVSPNSTCYMLFGSGPAPEVLANDDRCIVQYQIDGEYQALTPIEKVVRQWSHDLRHVDADRAIISLATLVKVAEGSTGVFRIRVGGTPDFTDGELIAELTTNSAEWENRLAQGFLINPRGLVLVKLTGLVPAGAGPASIRGATVTALEAT